MHVDDFIFQHHATGSDEAYAAFFLSFARLPAYQRMMWDRWINQFQLFCTHKNKRYRVTGASRLGDIWLTQNFEQDTGYDLRVDVDTCSNWSGLLEG